MVVKSANVISISSRRSPADLKALLLRSFGDRARKQIADVDNLADEGLGNGSDDLKILQQIERNLMREYTKISLVIKIDGKDVELDYHDDENKTKTTIVVRGYEVELSISSLREELGSSCVMLSFSVNKGSGNPISLEEGQTRVMRLFDVVGDFRVTFVSLNKEYHVSDASGTD